jgi:hypothetical protein
VTRARRTGRRDPQPPPPATPLAGLSLLFDRVVALYLLYRVERLQLDEQDAKLGVTAGTRRWRDVLGAEHFLRLLVRLPDFVPHATLLRQDLRLLTNTVNHFLKRAPAAEGRGGGSDGGRVVGPRAPLRLVPRRFMARYAGTFLPTEAYLRAGDLYARAYGVRPGEGTAALVGALAAAGEGGGGGTAAKGVWELAQEVTGGKLTAGR